jgi:hypothetical protein
MVIDMNLLKLKKIAQLRQFLDSTRALEFASVAGEVRSLRARAGAPGNTATHGQGLKHRRVPGGFCCVTCSISTPLQML